LAEKLKEGQTSVADDLRFVQPSSVTCAEAQEQNDQCIRITDESKVKQQHVKWTQLVATSRRGILDGLTQNISLRWNQDI
jgi:hypothetical protein